MNKETKNPIFPVTNRLDKNAEMLRYSESNILLTEIKVINTLTGSISFNLATFNELTMIVTT